MCFIWHPGRPCCSGLGHSSQPLGKQVRLFCSPKVRAHFILLPNRRGETLLERQLKAKDQRIKLMSEILAGIKVDLWAGQYNHSFLFQLRFWSSTPGRCLSWAPLTLSGVKKSRCWSFFDFDMVIIFYHFSRCWSGSPSSGLSPTSPSPPFPSSWLSQPSSPTYTGRNWSSPKSTFNKTTFLCSATPSTTSWPLTWSSRLSPFSTSSERRSHFSLLLWWTPSSSLSGLLPHPHHKLIMLSCNYISFVVTASKGSKTS